MFIPRDFILLYSVLVFDLKFSAASLRIFHSEINQNRKKLTQLDQEIDQKISEQARKQTTKQAALTKLREQTVAGKKEIQYEATKINDASPV